MALGRELEDFFRAAMQSYSWAQDAEIRDLQSEEARDNAALRALMNEARGNPRQEGERPGIVDRIWQSLFGGGGGGEQPAQPQQALQVPQQQQPQPQQALQTPQQPQSQPQQQREALAPPEILGVQVATNPQYRPGAPLTAQDHVSAVERIWNAATRMGRPDLGMRAISAYWSGLQNATASSLALGLQAMRSGNLPMAQRVLQQAYNLYYPSNDVMRISIDGNRLVAQRFEQDGKPVGEPTPVTEQYLYDTLLTVSNPLEFAKLTLQRETLAENVAYRQELIRLRETESREAAEDRRMRYMLAEADRRDRIREGRYAARLNSFMNAFTDVQKTLLENDTAKRAIIDRLAADDRRLAERLSRDPGLDAALQIASDAARVAGERLVANGQVPNARLLVSMFANGIVFDGGRYFLPAEAVRVDRGRYKLSVGGREIGVFDREDAEAVLGALNIRLRDGE